MMVQMFTVGRFFTNCYVVSCEKTKETIIIDPGFDTESGGRKIFEFVKSVETIKAIAILCQQHEGFIKLSLRSKSPINVQRVALAFGGGGHKFASGCVIKGSLEKAEQMVLKRIKEELLRKSNKK